MGGESEERLEELIASYSRLIHSVVSRVARRRDTDLGEDVTQEIALALWKQLRAERAIDNPAAYIYRCAVRETVRLISREIDGGRVPLETPAMELVPAAGVDPEQRTRAREIAEAVERALAQMLPERAAAVRSHLAGLGTEEIMRHHDWPHTKARNLVARGMADLRARLRQRGDL